MKKHYLLNWVWGMLLWGTVNVSAQNAALKKFPEGSQPQEVGDRIVNKFLKTPHTRFGNPRAEKAPNYADCCGDKRKD